MLDIFREKEIANRANFELILLILAEAASGAANFRKRIYIYKYISIFRVSTAHGRFLILLTFLAFLEEIIKN